MISSKDVIKKLRNAGWRLVRVRGDHWHFAHEERPGLVTVKHPTKDLSIHLVKSMEKQAGIRLL